MATSTRTCSNCGYPVDPSFSFCLNCGKVVSGNPAPAPEVMGGMTDSDQVVWTDDFGMGFEADSFAARPFDGTSDIGGFEPGPPQEQGSELPRPITTDGFCRECGSRTRAGWVYCLNCGTVLIPESFYMASAGFSQPDIGHAMSDSGPVAPAGYGFISAETADMGLAAGDWVAGAAAFDDDPAEILIDDDDEVAMVYEDEPTITYALNRVATGEQLQLELPCTVGRGSMADVRVGGNPYIGRVHVRLFSSDGALCAEDEGSANHTYLNGSRLTPGMPVSVVDGDTLTLAKEDFIVVCTKG